VRSEIFDERVYKRPYIMKADVFELKISPVCLPPDATALFNTIVYANGECMDMKIHRAWHMVRPYRDPSVTSIWAAFMQRDRIRPQPTIIMATSWGDFLITELFDQHPSGLLVISPREGETPGRGPHPRILVLESGYSIPEIYMAIDKEAVWDPEGGAEAVRSQQDPSGDDDDSTSDSEDDDEDNNE